MTDKDSDLVVNLPTIDFKKMKEVSTNPPAFHPNLKLIQGTSGEIANGAVQGEWWLDKTNLTKSLQIVVCGVRYHAIHIKEKKKVAESYNPDSPVFAAIKGIKNSQQEYGMHGTDFLIWIPTLQKFSTYLAGKYSSRPTGYEILDYMEPIEQRDNELKKVLPHTNCFNLHSEFVDHGEKYRCFEPRVTPIDPDGDLFPPQDILKSAAAVFTKPIENEARITVADTPDEER